MSRFPRAPMGYDRKQVDAFFHRPPAADEVWTTVFTTQMDGYDMQAVDTARAELVAAGPGDWSPSVPPQTAGPFEPAPFEPGPAGQEPAGPIPGQDAAVHGSQDIARQIAQARFPVSRTSGYDQQEVDAYLAALAAGPPPAPGALRSAAFRTVRLRAGYQAAAVNAFLAGLADRIERADPAPSLADEVAADDPDDPGGAQRLLRRVQGARFSTARRGYAMDEVDAFLERLAASLRDATAAPMATGEVNTVAFRTCGALTVGYDADDVDAFLDEVAAALTALGR